MKIKNLIMISLFTALIAAGAFIKIPVPVCPFTLQLLFTTLAGILLGAKNGAISVLCYIFLGLVGVPVFASGGGLNYIFEPTFGYLIGFAVGTYITGFITNNVMMPSLKRMLVGNFLGLAVVYIFGMIYYWGIMTFYVGTGIGLWTLFLYCFIMAVPGDIVLCIYAAFLGKRIIPVIRKNEVLVSE